MTSGVTSSGKEKPERATKPAEKKRKRLPRSISKYIRRTKASLRRELPAADAEKAIASLVAGLRK